MKLGQCPLKVFEEDLTSISHGRHGRRELHRAKVLITGRFGSNRALPLAGKRGAITAVDRHAPDRCCTPPTRGLIFSSGRLHG
jgi:hypothetical protein